MDDPFALLTGIGHLAYVVGGFSAKTSLEDCAIEKASHRSFSEGASWRE